MSRFRARSMRNSQNASTRRRSGQDKRLEMLENTVREIGALTLSVQRLAQSLESMVEEQERQGRRLQALEDRDGEKWRKLMGYIATALTSGAVTLLLSQII